MQGFPRWSFCPIHARSRFADIRLKSPVVYSACVGTCTASRREDVNRRESLFGVKTRSVRGQRRSEYKGYSCMAVFLINPSDNSFGTAVITPRWLFVLAAATPRSMGDPVLVDESIEALDATTIEAGDIVGISVHTGNALRGY